MPTDDLHSLGAPEIAFGPFRLYPQQRLLFRADTPLRLGSRAREILVTLVERAGEVVKKRELMGRVWPDTIVEEGSLRVHVAALRKALGDGGAAAWPAFRNAAGGIADQRVRQLCVELPTEAASARAESGLSGWCAAEILRVKAETLLRKGGGTAAAEGLLHQSLSIATKQGALSWELRTATSLARLWHGQRRTRRAHGLLASVLARFTEGFDTTDLINAKTLLERMAG